MALIEFCCEKCSQVFTVLLHERVTVQDTMTEIRRGHARQSPQCSGKFGAAFCRTLQPAAVSRQQEYGRMVCSARAARAGI